MITVRHLAASNEWHICPQLIRSEKTSKFRRLHIMFKLILRRTSIAGNIWKGFKSSLSAGEIETILFSRYCLLVGKTFHKKSTKELRERFIFVQLA